jgi:hypothetical protein
VHVRFRCSSGDGSCTHASDVLEPNLADQDESELMEMLAE